MFLLLEEQRSFHGATGSGGQAGLLSSIKACKTRAILTAEQAIDIFKIKISGPAAIRQQLSPSKVARAFGVNEKTVRDIWKGRTWFRETMHLDPARVITAASLRPPGRPRFNTSLTLEMQTTIPKPKHAAEGTSSSSTFFENDLAPASAAAAERPPNAFAVGDRLQAAAAHTDVAFTPLCAFSLNDKTDFNSLGGRLQLWSAVEAAPLPESSRADDPFHDDWRYWPQQEDGEAAR